MAGPEIKRRFSVLVLALAVLAAMTLIWGFAVEPLLLTVTELELADSRLPPAFDGTRVVYITDLHVGPNYSPADIERVVDKVQALDPDLVLFGGDLLEHEGSALRLDMERVAAAFARLEPRLGKYAIYGNHDIISPATKQIAGEILSGGGFTILENSAVEVSEGFNIAGTAPWPMSGRDSPMNRADIDAVSWATENNAFSLLLAHEPAQIRDNAVYPFALQLSGHTHGGQVALPLFGPIILPDGTEVFKFGWYYVDDTQMYVSRGIGTSIVRVRLFVPPEIVVLTLHAGEE